MQFFQSHKSDRNTETVNVFLGPEVRPRVVIDFWACDLLHTSYCPYKFPADYTLCVIYP